MGTSYVSSPPGEERLKQMLSTFRLTANYPQKGSTLRANATWDGEGGNEDQCRYNLYGVERLVGVFSEATFKEDGSAVWAEGVGFWSDGNVRNQQVEITFTATRKAPQPGEPNLSCELTLSNGVTRTFDAYGRFD